ncbi:major royal jelly protein [Hortaea werneckii]|nr:major royal jelly protein [Hortaea werneckii]
MLTKSILCSLALAGIGSAQSLPHIQTGGLVQNTSRYETRLRVDNGTYGPEIEEVHYYYDQWPIGIAVASDGRIFTTYTRGDYDYTLGVVVNETAEEPYPSRALNLPPDQLNTSWHGIPFGVGTKGAFISVQAVYITSQTVSRPETLWVLDTGRPTIQNNNGDPSMPYAQPGGPKLCAISLSNNTVYRTYTFPADVHCPDSYLNDLRFDLRSNVSGTSGEGIAYLVDSSNEGRPGFIMVDLGTGESWRRLTQDPSVLRGPEDVPSYQGHPFYLRQKGSPTQWQLEGLDGIQLSPDGKTMYYSPLSTNYLWSVPTANLREHGNALAEIHAHANVSNHGQRGGNANGFEGDSNGLIYQLMPEHNAVYYYDPADGQTHGFVRDPRILWPDGASNGEDGYMYININQLPYQPAWNNGQDLRSYPGAILRLAYQAEAEAYAASTPSNPTASSTTALPSMDMNKFATSFQNFGKTVSSSVSPFAQRSQQWIREQTGNVGEKTELPHDYIELETRIDALKQTHQKLLAATSQYANEAYDYPPNIRESFQDLGKSISEKVNLLSKANSAAEAQAAFTAPPSAKPQPKTFPHAIARASLAGSQSLTMATPQGSTEPDPLAQGLEKFAIAEEKVGEARLEQDEKIQGRFLSGWSTTLNQSLKAADKARTAVTNARLSLDAAKGRAAASGKHEESYTEEQRKAIEQAEDVFVEKVDEATSVMRNVLDTPEPLRNLAELAKAQAEFHQRSGEILDEVAKNISDIQMAQETSYRQAREGQ